MTQTEKAHLVLPQLKDQHITKVRTFSHSYRQGGPKVVHQVINNKHIFHNYGFGAAAVSISYGSSNISAKSYSIFFDVTTSDGQCAVIGAGVMGLMTALQLIKRGRRVTIYSQKIPEQNAKQQNNQIVSQIAPSAWIPSQYDWSQDMLKHQLFSKLSYDFFREALTLHKYQSMKAITAYDNSRQPEDLKQIVSSYVCDIFKPAEIVYQNGSIQNGSLYKTIHINSSLFLEELRIQAVLRGVRFVQKKFNSLQEIMSLKEEAIWNCTNSSSSYLFEETNLKQEHYLMVAYEQLTNHKYQFVLKSANKGEPEFELHCFGKSTVLLIKTAQNLRTKEEIKKALSDVKQVLTKKRMSPKL